MSGVSNNEADPAAAILRDAAARLLRMQVVQSLWQLIACRANQFKLMPIGRLARVRNRERAQANFIRRFKPIWVVQIARQK